ncbi:SDR family NAD(P)-dependent oxidoreductase [Pseudoalteromonas sp. JBTF-M23]|uniref:SDR family NAD(P)-dependent oxidoreductase n=1 Tax=Pseudoalteromonas caenipelagi TaxID=2726988 RepID=A0A849V9N8_9GAMM|nr:SDR family NAD(P)-dependent oxidoreductase [Pseudoalteromonas caenipelagi]NOU50319.1 SDR family NAD(P)-dependent oxidoreductase [Pseudoalteromonas caenipelagi]
MKRVLITGATSGIGRGLAEQYANDHIVYACGRNEQALSELTQIANITALQMDVTKIDEIKSQCAQIDALDLLILNAGNCEYIDDAKHFDSALFKRVIDVNLLSLGYCLEVLLPRLREGGQLIIVSSSASFLALPRAQAYGASKAGATYLAQSLAVDLDHIDVSVVHPGFVKTPLTDKNDFSMPMAVSVEQATKAIMKGISKRKKEIHFPKRFTFILKLLQLLPFSMWLFLSKGIRR